MNNNSFGNIFRITTWGESHGKAIGVVIDGCPAGLEIQDSDINEALAMRAPGRSVYTSERRESDRAEILSGIFEGKTTGAPISIIIYNDDIDSSKYEPIKKILRPGHANYTYLEKYGIFDYRGGGRASARETVCRVAAGAIAKKILIHYGIEIIAYIKKVGTISAQNNLSNLISLKKATLQSPIFCPDPSVSKSIMNLIESIKIQGDSLGGIVEFIAEGLPVGLGDPIYEKLEANLAKAMLSISACKGFEIGEGFFSVEMLGSEHNDSFITKNEKILTKTNHAGGILGGISTGMPLIGRIVFKPTSSIKKSQKTVDIDKHEVDFILPEGSRHDPCVAIRAVPVVEAMIALVLVDAVLLNRNAKL